MEIKAPINGIPSNNQVISYKGNNMKLTECVREFLLPKQFPSTAKEANCTMWRYKNENNVRQLPISTVKIINGMRVKPFCSMEPSLPCKKLRIMSPNGRDLGEFNVELRDSRDKLSKGQILTITKSNTSKLVNKPVTISFSSMSHVPKQTFPPILRPEFTKMSKKKLTDIITDGQCIFNGNNKTSQKVPRIILPMKKVVTIGRNETNKKIQIYNNINFNKMSSFISEKSSKNSINHTGDSDNDRKCIEIEPKQVTSVNSNDYATNNVNVLSKVATLPAPTENKIPLTVADMSLKKIIESPFPIVNCIDLANKTDDDNYMQMQFKACKEKHSVTKNVENEQKAYSDNMSNFSQGYRNIDRDMTRQSVNNNHKESQEQRISESVNILSQRNNLTYGIKQMCETKIERNVMTVIPNNDTLPFDKMICTPEHNINIISLRSDNNIDHNVVTRDVNHIICSDTENKCISMEELENDGSLVILEAEGSRKIDKNIEIIKQNRDQPKSFQDLFQEDLSDQWNIIKEAVSSVKDEELRTLALKALADCSIGMERRVPVRPPEKLITVHDTQVQTIVFGLLDPKSFVLINKDLDSIKRIPQVIFHDNMQNSLVENDLHLLKNSEFDTIDAITQKIDSDLEEFINKMCEENSDTLRVKQTLSTTTTRYTKIIDQLQKDYESVKKYNQDGRLSIHEAVVNNNIFDVRRHLMVLKQCKKNVDILTQNGETSLELAIKNDVCSEIVKLLLQAGAQPIIRKPMHESALIIAAKQSSVLLPKLINYVKDKKSLDQVDSEGFAALHYCCMYNNFEGVHALISAGASIDLKDMKSGRTPLFLAIDRKHIKVAQKLLYAGAVENIANYAGQTLLPTVNDVKSTPFRVMLKKKVP